MTKSMLLLTFLCLLPAAVAVGQLDQDPDGIGLYADLGGMDNRLLTEPGVVEIHLLATNITGPMIKTWIASVVIDGGATITGISVPYEHDYLLANPAPHTWEYGVTAFPDSISTYSELVPAPVVHLATFELVVSDTDPVDLYLGLIREGAEPNAPPLYGWWERVERDDPPGWVGYVYHSQDLHPSSGSHDLPVMRINGEAPVPTVARSWGAVKAAFR